MGTAMPKTIVITGASSGFGASSARHLADAGHTVYAGIRGTTGKNAQAVADAVDYASQHHVQLRPIEMDVSDQGSVDAVHLDRAQLDVVLAGVVEMDVSDQGSVDAAIATILAEAGGIDVVVHNAGHRCSAPPTRSPSSRSRPSPTRTCCRPSGSTGRSCRTCGPSATACCCGSARPAPAAAPRPTWDPTSRPRPPWIPLPSATPPRWPASASTPSSSSPAPSPRAQTTSPTPGTPRTTTSPRTTRPGCQTS